MIRFLELTGILNRPAQRTGQFLDHGGHSLYASKQSPGRKALLILILASFVLAACGAQLANENWPGLTKLDDTAYVAFGPGIYAVNVPEREAVWVFPAGLESGATFFAAPAVNETNAYFGDFGVVGGFFNPSPRVSLYAVENVDNGAAPLIWQQEDAAGDRIVAPASQSETLAFFGTADNDVLALNKDTGNVVWRFEAEHSIWGQPVYQDEVLYVASLDKNLYALNAANGELIWTAEFTGEADTPGSSGSLPSQPVIDGDTIYVSSFDEKIHAIDLDSGVEKWSNDAEDVVWGAPAVADGRVFFGDINGKIYAVTTAGEPLWQAQAKGLIQTAPIEHNGIVYFVSGLLDSDDEVDAGEILALDAETGAEVWQRSIPAAVFTTPVVIGDELVVAPLNFSALLLVFDLEDGTQTWEFIPPASE
jgi:outer membrane protein assembly factor BamB